MGCGLSEANCFLALEIHEGNRKTGNIGPLQFFAFIFIGLKVGVCYVDLLGTFSCNLGAIFKGSLVLLAT